MELTGGAREKSDGRSRSPLFQAFDLVFFFVYRGQFELFCKQGIDISSRGSFESAARLRIIVRVLSRNLLSSFRRMHSPPILFATPPLSSLRRARERSRESGMVGRSFLTPGHPLSLPPLVEWLPVNLSTVFLLCFISALAFGSKSTHTLRSPRSAEKRFFVVLAFRYLAFVSGCDLEWRVKRLCEADEGEDGDLGVRRFQISLGAMYFNLS